MVPDYRFIEQLESELKIGPYEHPYGLEPEGLIDEVRVEHEAWYRKYNRYGMPPLIERLATAEAEACKRWPAFFADPERPDWPASCANCPYNVDGSARCQCV